jgi:hypothetical protein
LLRTGGSGDLKCRCEHAGNQPTLAHINQAYPPLLAACYGTARE